MMSCREMTEFLMDYLSGELDAPTRSRFEEHISQCPPCVVYLKTYEEAVRMGREAMTDPCEDIPPELVQAILNAMKPKP